MKTSASPWQSVLVWFRRFVLIGLALYAVGISMGLGLSLIPHNRSYWEFGRMVLWLALLPVPAAILLALALRGWRVLPLLLPPLVAWSIHYIPHFLPKVHSAPPQADVFTVLTFNVLTPDEGKENLLQVIQDADADIVALQELSLTVAEYLQANLAAQYPYSALHGQQWTYYRGQGVFSKFPILEDEYWVYMDIFSKSHGHQRAVVEVDGQPLAVYNVHPWPPFEWYGGLRFRFSTTPDNAHRTAVERLLPRIDAETLPVLVVGDLNTSPYHEEYNWLAARLTDSFREGGTGLGHTYPACGVGPLGAVIRIDHVFHSEEMTALNALVLNGCPASDHHPLLVELALTEP